MSLAIKFATQMLKFQNRWSVRLQTKSSYLHLELHKMSPLQYAWWPWFRIQSTMEWWPPLQRCQIQPKTAGTAYCSCRIGPHTAGIPSGTPRNWPSWRRILFLWWWRWWFVSQETKDQTDQWSSPIIHCD